MKSMLMLVMLALFMQVTNGAARNKIPNEIKPDSATQSRTMNNDEAKYGAARGIDGDQATNAYIQKSSDPYSWYRVKFGKLQCISQVKWFWGSTGSTVLTWNCDASGCGKCSGHSKCDDGSLVVKISAEATSTDGLPAPSGCKYGDTFELQHNADFYVYEIAFAGKEVEVETCVEEKEKLEQAINDNIGLNEKLSEIEGKLDEANKAITELIAELQQANEHAEKKACPGEGIWVIPENVLEKKISGKMIENWKKDGLKDNVNYLSSYKGVKITKDLARYIECFATVN